MKTSFKTNINRSDKNDNKTNDEIRAKTDDNCVTKRLILIV
jgi:hypothetical protein